ncbi:MAG: hypothetical protein HKN91_00465 [Acidimicrobiia bacterium]|nr:hypothetical protein [Acidimicrobiia bacterium]
MRFIALTKYTPATDATWWRQLVEVTAYPATVVMAVAIGYVWIDTGLNPALVLPVMIVATGLFIFALEHLHPYVGEWRLTPNKLRADLLHTVFSKGAVQLGFQALILGGLVWVADRRPACFRVSCHRACHLLGASHLPQHDCRVEDPQRAPQLGPALPIGSARNHYSLPAG